MGFEIAPTPDFEAGEPKAEQGYDRRLLRFPSSDGGTVAAHLLMPSQGDAPFPGVLVHHQHNGQHWLGKSEPVGLAGDRLQAFGPALARHGIVVLAPDAIGFEDRRAHAQGIEPHPEDGAHHQNHLTCRLVAGDTLMRNVLADSALALSLLRELPHADSARIGMLGHSYGGNTVLFHAPLDERVRFACVSGAAASYRARMAAGTGIELAQVIPGFLQRFEIQDLAACMAARPLLIVSAAADRYSVDADEVETAARRSYETLGAGALLEHFRFEGGHALTSERLALITSWIVENARAATR